MVTLEKIDQVVDRTGVTYEQARDALNACEGDVIDAIIYLEKSQHSFMENINIKSSEVTDTLKDLLKKGNVTRVLVEKDGEVLLNLPVTVGAIGLVMAPVVAMIGVGAAFVTKYTIKIVKEDGEEIDVNKMTEEKVAEVKKMVDEKLGKKDLADVTEDLIKEVEKETEKVKEKLLSLGLKQEGNKFELITNSYATFRMKLKELENVNVIISTNKTSDFYQIIARLKNVDSTMELKKQGELPFTPIEVKQVIQEQQFLNDVADNVFEELSEEEKQILKKKIENGDYNLNCKI